MRSYFSRLGKKIPNRNKQRFWSRSYRSYPEWQEWFTLTLDSSSDVRRTKNDKEKVYLNLFRSSSRMSRAMSLPPRPKARPPAKATITTIPVNKILTKSCATPSWFKTTRIVKKIISHLVKTESVFAEVAPIVLTLCLTRS